MNTQPIKHKFNISELNLKIHNLESNGFEQYLNTWEKQTVHGYDDMNHVIMTCTKGHYDGLVVDIYYNEKTNRCWLEYSGQTKNASNKEVLI